MPAVRLLPPDRFFDRQQWAALTRASPWRGVWLVAHAWIVTAALIGVATWLHHPIAWLAAIIFVGGRQLGLAILMHDAAHGALHPDRKLNNFLGQWLTGAAVGSDLIAYRTYHLQHHKFTQQPEDPDLSLSAPFPTTRASLWRKVFRDLSGQTFFKQRKAQFAFAAVGLKPMLRGEAAEKGRASTKAGTPFNKQSDDGVTSPTADVAGAMAVTRAVGRFLLVQTVLLALSLLLWGWTPFLLWLAALATTFQLYLRIRNIAEHACTTTGSDDPFTHARTTRAGWLARATVAPYWVNYHAEHHLFMGVPCYRLPQVHEALGRADKHRAMTIAPNYAAVLRQVTAAG
ncbi:fatty acid desaturase family protein [Sphingopyxis sp. XHP0097]|uniref:Fatty acid desaturase family protein n=1 Tax=Sphingopyxis jiangsuensis TaxID=2871171 RepID=A0ABS7MB55_9SPHN|nr:MULTISPECIES: fatty acid desaturase family protein [Sphingopyxis]MBY4636262.1 fatty acid desaturase family protein [Sphingopyxis jiangsuensis]